MAALAITKPVWENRGYGSLEEMTNAATGQFKISNEQINQFYSELMKMMSTQGQAQKNQAMDYAAYNRLPYSTASAQGRAIDYGSLLAGQKGLTDMKQWQLGTNIESAKFLEQLKLQKDLAEMAQGNWWEQLIGAGVGGVGTGVGSYLGKSLFDYTPIPAKK